jgi:hypothetical protein
MDGIELRERAKQEADELGPVPANPREHEIWIEERRGAIVLLAGLADWNRQLSRSAATGEWVSITVRNLLLAAMHECH